MKYFLIIGAFLLISEAFAGTEDSSSATESCEHATQDTHTVSNNAYNKLLVQLTQNDIDEETETSGSTKGQR